MDPDQQVARLEKLIVRLGGFPDRDLIHQITECGRLGLRTGGQPLVERMCAAIMDVLDDGENGATAAERRVPLFYALDSVVKNVGDVFQPLLSVRVRDAFGRAFAACAEKDKKAQASNPWPSARNPHANRPLFYRRTANHLSRREARLKTYTMLSLLAATPALRCPAPMMQTGQGEMTPVGSAPGWAARRGGRFSGGVVPTTSAMATSAMAIHEATRDAEPNVGNYVAPHTAPGAQAPSAESNPQVYSKWLATRNDGGAGVEGALAERAMAEQTAAQLAAQRAEQRVAAEQAELARIEAVRAASERASAERHAQAMEQKAMADRAAADRVAAGRAAAANMHAQRAAKAAEEQAMADQAFAARQAAGKAAAAAWIRGRAP